jgi:hypothetical protein
MVHFERSWHIICFLHFSFELELQSNKSWQNQSSSKSFMLYKEPQIRQCFFVISLILLVSKWFLWFSRTYVCVFYRFCCRLCTLQFCLICWQIFRKICNRVQIPSLFHKSININNNADKLQLCLNLLRYFSFCCWPFFDLDSFLILQSFQSPHSAIEICKMTSVAFELVCFLVEIV